MNLWTFKCFLKEKESDLVDVVTEWYEEQSVEVQAKFDNTIEFLSQQPNWERPHIGVLTDECKGLIEIRFKADRKQHRPLGCYDGVKTFLFLLPEVIEKDNKFIPKNACNIALRRKNIVEGDRNCVQICEFED